MDLEFLNTSGIDEDAWGKGKKKTRGSGTPAFTELAEESARTSWNRRKGRREYPRRQRRKVNGQGSSAGSCSELMY